MNLLLMDTSSASHLSLAVSTAQGLRYRNWRLSRSLSSSMTRAIEQVLALAGLRVDALEGVGVGLGPGSFTGLRVGVSTAKALAYALQIPLVGISSLEALAMGVAGEGPIVCLVDAKRRQVYGAVYERRQGRLHRMREIGLWPVAEIGARLPAGGTLIGDGLGVWWRHCPGEATQIRERFTCIAQGRASLPQARHLLPMALERLAQGQSDDIQQLTPLYVYPEDCQVRR